MIVGIGVDLIETMRVKKIFNTWGDKFLKKILSTNEHQKFVNYQYEQSYDKQINFLAKRFAAKEAIGKALGFGMQNPVKFQSIEISNNKNGQPYPIFYNQLKIYCEEKRYTFHLSISDQRSLAQAFAVVEVF